MSDFLGKDYELPVSGGSGSGGRYLKLAKGTTRFRVLSDKALKGWVYWNTDNKPSRSLEKPEDPSDARINEDGSPDRVKHFWAFVVLDYADNEIKILEVTQASIQRQFIALILDVDWGDPNGYDLKITREGEKLETTYQVTPGKQSPIPADVKARFEAANINLNALLTGDDPFASNGNGKTAAKSSDLSAQIWTAAQKVGWSKPNFGRYLVDEHHVDEQGRPTTKNLSVDEAEALIEAISDPALVAHYNDNASDIPF